MEKIASFTVNHQNLFAGVYVSRKDYKNSQCVTTFDIRITAPNKEPVMDTPAIHTIEHLGATFLRNSAQKDDVVYFGPMGCRTGFYLLVFGEKSSEEIWPLVKEMFEFIILFSGEIPGAAPEECGNWSEQNLGMAKYYAKKFLSAMNDSPNFTYPQ